MVTYCRPNDFCNSIESIQRHTTIPHRITIIDNSCGKLDTVFVKYPQIQILRSPTNLGKGQSVNHFYKQIAPRTPFILMDQDIVVPPDWLSTLLIDWNRLTDAAIIAPTITHKDGDTLHNQLQYRRPYMHRFTTPLINLGNGLYRCDKLAGPMFLISHNFFTSIGGFLSNKIYGSDDSHLCRKAKQLNLITAVSGNVVVKHVRQDETEGYRNWKRDNINKDAGQIGYWD